MHNLIFKLKKVKGTHPAEIAARHNLREIAAELGGYGRIDPRKSYLNIILEGANHSKLVELEATELLKSGYKKKIRKDAVLAIEAIFCPDIHFEGNLMGLFRDSLEWIRAYLKVPILNAVIHFDEGIPHMHVVMLPLRGGKLTAKEICGYKSQQRAMNDDYFQNVGNKYGIYKPIASHLIPPEERLKMTNHFLDTLIQFPEKLTEYRDVLRRVIQTNPLPLLNAIGIHPNIKAREEFIEIMTRQFR